MSEPAPPPDVLVLEEPQPNRVTFVGAVWQVSFTKKQLSKLAEAKVYCSVVNRMRLLKELRQNPPNLGVACITYREQLVDLVNAVSVYVKKTVPKVEEPQAQETPKPPAPQPPVPEGMAIEL